MKMDAFKESLGDVVNGLTPQPKAEEATGHAGTAGEVSTVALSKSTDDGAFVLTPSGSLSASTASITRATMRCAIEPWRIAQDPEAHKKRTCVGRVKGCKACQLVAALYKAQLEVASAMNLVARDCYAVDAALLDAFRVKHGRGPKGKELEFCSWKGDGTGYQRVRKAFPELLSGIAAALTREVTVKWMRDRWNVLVKCEKAPAFYRDTAPVPLRAADCKLTESDDTRDVFHLAFSLTSGRVGEKGKEFVLPLRCKDQKQYNALQRIAAGADRMGQIEIQRDSRSDKWFLRVAYKRLVGLARDGKAAAINRGITCILVAVTETGESTIEDGVAIEKHLAQLTARRHEFQNAWRLSSRKGRGRARTLAPLKKLEDDGERWRKTRLQEIARQTAKWLQARGVSRVYFDDFKDIRNTDVKLLDGGKPVWDRIQRWPYFQMGTRLRACLEEYGIEVVVVDPARNSLTCPVCAHVQDGPVTSRKWKCPKCKHQNHTDVVFCLNALEKGERLRAERNPP